MFCPRSRVVDGGQPLRRALKRLKDVFQGIPGGIEGIWR
jgi:hypothetical protein